MSLQDINSRVAVNRLKPHDEHWKVWYQVFDIMSPEPMWKRAEWLERLSKKIGENDAVKVSVPVLANTELEADYHFKLWLAQGYEGMMYRSYDAPYGFEDQCGNKENRWWSLMKRKNFLDVDATCTGIYEGEDGFTGLCGGLEMRLDDGTVCRAGSGLSMEQRARFWANPDEVTGKRVRINYEMRSDGGNLLKPTIECVYE